jgi:hypothetical protein
MTAAEDTRPSADTPSWDENAERALLGAVMQSADARTAAATITASDFYRPSHGQIYDAVLHLAKHRRKVEPITVLDELGRRKHVRPGYLDAPYLHTCQAACATPANADEYVAIVREHSQRRTIRERLHSLEQLHRHDLTDSDVIARFNRDLTSLTDLITGITTNTHRKTHLMPASAVPLKRVRWLWDTTPHGEPPTSHGRIPLNTLTIAAGPPGVGKSQWLVWLTALITRGELPGELAGEPRGVIYAAAEDSWSYTIAPRLIAAGADLDYVYRVEVDDDHDPHARLTLPVDTREVGRICEAQGIALFAADPLLSLIDGHVNDYRATEVRAALEPLIAAADQYDFTILGLAHFTKNGGNDPLTRLAGSGAFGQLIRALIAFAKDDDDGSYVMSLEKNNLGRDNLPGHSYSIQPVTVETPEGDTYVSRFVLGEQTEHTVSKVMRDATGVSAADRAEASDTMLWLREHLMEQGGTDTSQATIKAANKNGISRSALYRAKDKLKVTTATTGYGRDRAATWSLPEHLLDGSGP